MESVYERLQEILRRDRRYALMAYQFVFEALNFTASALGKDYNSPSEKDRHVTGRELLEGIRRYGLQQYGFMARTVFECWGAKRDADFGEMVFNLVEAGLMGRTETDSRNDFKGVYDFKTAFEEGFRFENKFDIKMPFDAFWGKRVKKDDV